MKEFLAFLESLGAWGPGIVALIDGLGLPNPNGPDFMLLWYSTRRPDQAWTAATLTVCASLTGSFVLYWLARRGGQKYLDSKMQGPRALRFRNWFRHYGLLTVFIPALIPIPMPLKAFVLCAGAFGVGPVPYLATLAAGRLPRYFGMAYLGHELGENSTQWLKDHRWHFAAVAAGLFLLCYLLIKVVDRYRLGAGRRTAS